MPLPEHLESERKAVVQEIHSAFAGVSREGGVSWSEAYVIDTYDGEVERAAARARDTDRDWTELVADPNWSNHPGLGGYSFLDAIGFRYYLPASMCRVLEGHDRIDPPYMSIFGDAHDQLSLYLQLTPGRSNEYVLKQLSLLDQRQCRAVAAFMRYMIALDRHAATENELDGEIGWWSEAYSSYWNRFE